MRKCVCGIFVALAMASCQKEVESVTLSCHCDTLAVGRADTLRAYITPSAINDSILHWVSTDSSVVEVRDGVICGKRVGDAAVVVFAEGHSDTCRLNVKIGVDSLGLNVYSVRLREGSRLRLRPSVYPSNATDSLFSWVSSDTSVATVSDGIVETIRPGEATVTAHLDNAEARCSVSVSSREDWLTRMGKLAKGRGGNVDCPLRFTLQWNDKEEWNTDDLDAHCVEPGRTEICYGKKKGRTGGVLDVDIREPRYGQTAIENISWTQSSRLKPGVYKFNVERYSDRGGKSGFRAEIELNGQMYFYDYRGSWSKKKKSKAWSMFWGEFEAPFQYVPVCEVTVDDDGFMEIRHILTPLSSL